MQRLHPPHDGYIRAVDRISRRAANAQAAWITSCLTLGAALQIVRNFTGG